LHFSKDIRSKKDFVNYQNPTFHLLKKCLSTTNTKITNLGNFDRAKAEILAIFVCAFVTLGLDELDVRERKVANPVVQLTLPLSVYVHFGHFNEVPHFQPQRRFVVRVWHSRLFHSCNCRQFSLQNV